MKYVITAIAAALLFSALPAFSATHGQDGKGMNYQEMDQNQDGRVDRNEYQAYTNKDDFQQLDTDGDGYLSQDESRHMGMSGGQKSY